MKISIFFFITYVLIWLAALWISKRQSKLARAMVLHLDGLLHHDVYHPSRRARSLSEANEREGQPSAIAPDRPTQKDSPETI